ncbi:MAG TPA: restriction endonuclease subunit S [Thiopseudomonas sp.]|nr:restriction endonuclease subunit S [Thiopseudomonas sp.]
MSSPVPTEWITDELVRFCDIVGGGTPDRAVHEYWGGQIPWVSPTEVTSLASKYISKTKEGLTQLGLDKSSAKLHPPGTLLMTSRASIGYVAINTVPMATNQGFQSLRCKDGTLADYMYQYITWVRPELERLSAGSTFSEISSVNVKRLRVTLPPRPEQQKIATILSSVDDVIEKTRAQIDKLKDLKTGMMQELLTKGIGHTEFKDSPVGPIPAEWMVVRLGGSLECIDSGWSPSCIEIPPVPGKWGVLKVSSVTRGEFLENESKTLPDELLPRNNAQVHAGDVLLTRANGVAELVGKCVIVRKEPQAKLMMSDKILRLKPSQTLHNEFLLHVFNSQIIRKQIELSWGGSSGQKNIGQSDIKSYLIPLPSVEEQRLIARSITQVERVVFDQNKKLVALMNTKKALMQDLLTGKVRVKLTDKESAVV